MAGIMSQNRVGLPLPFLSTFGTHPAARTLRMNGEREGCDEEGEKMDGGVFYGFSSECVFGLWLRIDFLQKWSVGSKGM